MISEERGGDSVVLDPLQLQTLLPSLCPLLPDLPSALMRSSMSCSVCDGACELPADGMLLTTVCCDADCAECVGATADAQGSLLLCMS